MQHTLIHETGHALFLDDEVARSLIAPLTSIRNFCTPESLALVKLFPDYKCISYYADDKILDENVADYYVKYRTEEDFKDKYPEVYNYFKDKEKI